MADFFGLSFWYEALQKAVSFLNSLLTIFFPRNAWLGVAFVSVGFGFGLMRRYREGIIFWLLSSLTIYFGLRYLGLG